MQMYKKYFLYKYAMSGSPNKRKVFFLYKYPQSGSLNKRFYTNMHCQDPQISVAEDSLIFKGMGGAEMQVGRSGNQGPGITQICNDIVVQTQTVYQANVSDAIISYKYT